MTKSMIDATRDLDLQRLFVVYSGTQRYALDRKTDVLPLKDLLPELDKLRRGRGSR